MVDHDDRVGVSLDVRQAFVQDAPAKQIDRQAMFGGGGESAVQAGMVGVHRQTLAHADANAARAFRRRPFRHHIVDRRIGRIDRCHDPEFVRIGVVKIYLGRSLTKRVQQLSLRRSGGKQIDDLLDGFVGAVICGFQFTVWLVTGDRAVVEAAVGERTAEPFVEEEK